MRRFTALLLAAVLLLSSCATGTTDTQDILLVYFPAPSDAQDGISVITVPVVVPLGADKATIAFETLLNGAEGYASPYADGVTLVSIENTGGDGKTIWLSPEYDAMSVTARAVADTCAALTLFGTGIIAAVRFGSGDWYFPDDIITGSLAPESYDRELTLYFTDGGTGYVVAETRRVLLREGESLERYAAVELLKGPGSAELTSALPAGTELISISREDGTCYINLSAAYLDLRNKPLASELTALYAITNTLCAAGEVEAVCIAVEGERLYGGVSLRAVSSASGSYTTTTTDRTIYLPSQRSPGLFEPVTVRVDTLYPGNVARNIVEYITYGIDGTSCFLTPVPFGTIVNSVSITDGKCTVDLDYNGDLESVGYDKTITAMLALSLAANVSGITQIEILVDGTPVDSAAPDRALVHPDFR